MAPSFGKYIWTMLSAYTYFLWERVNENILETKVILLENSLIALKSWNVWEHGATLDSSWDFIIEVAKEYIKAK